MTTLISIELYKIFKKWRTYIAFTAAFLLAAIFHASMYFDGQNFINMSLRNLSRSFFIYGNLLNGYLVSKMILMSLFIHIPFLVTLVSGDLLAGEAASGTNRFLLIRPVPRAKILTAKFIAGAIYANILILFLAIVSLTPGILIFGTGELVAIGSKIIIFTENEAFWRLLCSYAFAGIGMTLVSSLAFLLSSLTENAIGPIIATMAIIIGFMIISNLNVEFLNYIKPYLFTSYISDWQNFFDDPINFFEIIKSALILSTHILAFYLISLNIFIKKDIL